MLHNSALMSRRLILALALSLALHGGLLLPDALKRLTAAPSPPALQAILRLPPRPEPPAAEPLLKNTLDAEEKPAVAKTLIVPPAPGKPAAKIRPDTKREVEVAQKKLSQYVFYPESARARGIEARFYLLLVLSADGTVEDVQIAVSSGYPILDNAAAKGAWAVQRLPGVKTGEFPYTFKLVP